MKWIKEYYIGDKRIRLCDIRLWQNGFGNSKDISPISFGHLSVSINKENGKWIPLNLFSHYWFKQMRKCGRKTVSVFIGH